MRRSYSSRSLKDRMLAASSTAAITARISVSRQVFSPTPFSMMPARSATNHGPGTTFDRVRSSHACSRRER